MKYKILNDIIDSEIGGSYYLLNINTGKYLKLNASSFFIYKHVKKRDDDRYIINQIITKFNLSQDQAKKDFDIFISSAIKLKIIKKLDD